MADDDANDVLAALGADLAPGTLVELTAPWNYGPNYGDTLQVGTRLFTTSGCHRSDGFYDDVWYLRLARLPAGYASGWWISRSKFRPVAQADAGDQ